MLNKNIMKNLEKYYKDRMEGLVNTQYLKEANALVTILTEQWIEEGFETEDVISYFAEIIKNTGKKQSIPNKTRVQFRIRSMN